MTRSLIKVGFVLTLLLPFLAVLVHFTPAASNWSHELIRVTGQSSQQAFFSASLSVLFGILVALGLVRFRGAIRRVLEVVVLLPSIMPSLIIIVSCINAFSLFGDFPFGFWGVVIVHTILNVGLIAVFFGRDLELFAGGTIELATIEGAKRFDILVQVLVSLKITLARYWFVVFVFCFSSFSIPLVLGLDRGETLDVLIYRTLLGRGDLGGAIYLSMVQIVALATMALLLTRQNNLPPKPFRSIQKISDPIALGGFIMVIGFMLISNIGDFANGAKEIFSNPYLSGFFIEQGVNTTLEALAAGAFTFAAFLIVLFLLPDKAIERFLFSYGVPSSAVLGLGFYLLISDRDAFGYVTTVILAAAFTLSILPTLFRIKILNLWQSIELQVLTARILGARRGQIFLRIVMPQAMGELVFVCGLCALWASGDFALASIISGEPLTLALAANSYLGGYRMHLATFYSMSSLVVGGIIFLIFERISRVYSSKLI